MLLLEIADIKKIIARIGLKQFFIKLSEYLKEDFIQWESFQKSPRHAVYVENGVIELMPIASKTLYSFKYVNGHPHNPKKHQLNIVAVGMLAEVATGYPLMVSEMTLLTAIRTAATSALASRYLAKKNSKSLAIIGCGAQSEFQVLAHEALFDLTQVKYFDCDPHAMQRFCQNVAGSSFALEKVENAKAAIQDVDIIITATAAKTKVKVIENAWLMPGQHISGIGGDSPGKTELDPEILKRSKVVVEYFPQTLHEGEIQNLGETAKEYVYAELWEILAGKKPGRTHDQENTVFDAVGFALEDYSILRLVYSLAKEYQLGKNVELVPEHLKDCKNLYGLLQ